MVEKLASSEIAQSRERFEEWAEEWFASEDVPLEYDPTELCYQHLAAHSSWMAWQAAERDTRERVAELLEALEMCVRGLRHVDGNSNLAEFRKKAEAAIRKANEVSR